MPLAPEMVYNDLNGEEVKEILLTRFADLLVQVPEFKRHLTLNRVRMKLTVNFEVFGRTPPQFALSDDLIVRTRDETAQNREFPPFLAGNNEIFTQNRSFSAEINSDTSKGGQPPDQVREEHGIPVQTVQKGPVSMEDAPVVRQEGIKYAFFATQDYGPMRNRTGNEQPILGDVISAKNTHGGRSEVGPDFTQVKDPNYVDKE